MPGGDRHGRWAQCRQVTTDHPQTASVCCNYCAVTHNHQSACLFFVYFCINCVYQKLAVVGREIRFIARKTMQKPRKGVSRINPGRRLSNRYVSPSVARSFLCSCPAVLLTRIDLGTHSINIVRDYGFGLVDIRYRGNGKWKQCSVTRLGEDWLATS